jgi:hypothetical protein
MADDSHGCNSRLLLPFLTGGETVGPVLSSHRLLSSGTHP